MIVMAASGFGPERSSKIVMARSPVSGVAGGRAMQSDVIAGVSRRQTGRPACPACLRFLLWMLAGACVVTVPSASAQSSIGRGARDPLQADAIVGSEGKGMFVGAGVPPGNTPI